MEGEVCRFCIRGDNNLIFALNKDRITDEENVECYEELVKKIDYCLDMKVSFDDQLSNWICLKCIDTLNTCNTFKKKCKAAEVFLSKYRINTEPEKPVLKQEGMLEKDITVVHTLQIKESPKSQQSMQCGAKNSMYSITISDISTMPCYEAPALVERKSERIFECIQCNSHFDTILARDTHVSQIHSRLIDYKPRPVFGCSQCDQSFNSISALDTHVSENHSPANKDISAESFECGHCSRRFKNLAGLKNHVRIVHVLKKKPPIVLKELRVLLERIDISRYSNTTSSDTEDETSDREVSDPLPLLISGVDSLVENTGTSIDSKKREGHKLEQKVLDEPPVLRPNITSCVPEEKASKITKTCNDNEKKHEGFEDLLGYNDFDNKNSDPPHQPSQEKSNLVKNLEYTKYGKTTVKRKAKTIACPKAKKTCIQNLVNKPIDTVEQIMNNKKFQIDSVKLTNYIRSNFMIFNTKMPDQADMSFGAQVKYTPHAHIINKNINRVTNQEPVAEDPGDEIFRKRMEQLLHEDTRSWISNVTRNSTISAPAEGSRVVHGSKKLDTEQMQNINRMRDSMVTNVVQGQPSENLNNISVCNSNINKNSSHIQTQRPAVPFIRVKDPSELCASGTSVISIKNWFSGPVGQTICDNIVEDHSYAN